MNRRREHILEQQVMEQLFTRIVPKVYNPEDASDVAQIEVMMWEGGSDLYLGREAPKMDEDDVLMSEMGAAYLTEYRLKESGELSTLSLREAVAEAKSIVKKAEQLAEEGMAVLDKMLEEFS